jgi:hypothetical protein
MANRDATPRAERFYVGVLQRIVASGVPFLVGGAYAMREYAGICRDTKDLDVFCLPGDYQRLLRGLAEAGYETSITNAEWLAKARCGEHFIDIIFASANAVCQVDGTWFEHARDYELFGCKVRLIPAEEQIWTKAYVQERDRFDGADVLHIIRKQGPSLDWKRLLSRMDGHWEILLSHLLAFRFVYPSERNAVPDWLMAELLDRAAQQLALPTPEDRICRGPLLSRTQYNVDIEEWGYRWVYKHGEGGKAVEP